MMTSRRTLLVVAAAALAGPPIPLHAQTLARITVATGPVDGAIGPLVALRGGFFRKHGLDVDLRAVTSGAAISAGVAGGAVNIAVSNLLTLITAFAKGIPFQIVAPGSMYLSEKPAEGFVVRNDGSIRTAADMNGKTIGSDSLNDLDAIATLAWIDQRGGDSRTIRRVELPSTATPLALESGRIDGAGLQEPRLSEVLQTGKMKLLGHPFDAIAKRFLVSGCFANADFTNANRDIVVRYARAQLEANAYANAHQDVTARWLAEFANGNVEQILHSPRKTFAESFDLALVQPVIDAAVRYKVIQKGFDAREFISPFVLG